MSWANLDDRLHAHPKVQELQAIPVEGMMAFGLWSWALSWCRAYSPDEGVIPVRAAARAWNAEPEQIRQLVDRLVEVEMAERDDRDAPTWAIHDWSDWQLDGRMRQSIAGKARAATAARSPAGTYLVEAGAEAGSQLSASSPKLDLAGIQPGHASPRLSTPRLSRAPARDDGDHRSLEEHGVKRPAKIAAADFHPVPKPVRTK